MAVRNFNDAEKQKLIQIISQGSQVLGEVEDLKGGLKDTVKAIAEELELKPALINKAISKKMLVNIMISKDLIIYNANYRSKNIIM